MLCSQESDSLLTVLEITGLPLVLNENKLRSWLEQQIGAEVAGDIRNIGLVTDSQRG